MIFLCNTFGIVLVIFLCNTFGDFLLQACIALHWNVLHDNVHLTKVNNLELHIRSLLFFTVPAYSWQNWCLTVGDLGLGLGTGCH